MPHHVIAVAESDSYLKWAVSLLGRLPGAPRIDVVIACSPVRPSPAQQAGALSGTAFAGRALPVLSPAALRRRVEAERPDAVLLACTGPTLHAFCDVLSTASHRPVLVAGIPGIALPSRRRAWAFRGAIDLMVVHSHHEVVEYDRSRVLTGKQARIGLATIPFLAPDALAAGGAGDAPVLLPYAQEGPRVRTRVLFATQGKVPRVKEQRVEILTALHRLAKARPDLTVVVKTRGVPGEFHTHYERYHYELLWRELVAGGGVPRDEADLLEFAAGSMAEQLRTAAALVTVSSTAVLEAMALDVPVLLVDDFGITEEMINQVFVGSGCQRDLQALAAGDFHHPEGWWRQENYFHPVSDNTWTDLLDELVKRAAAGELPPLAAGLDPGRSPRRRRLDRLRLSPAGSAASRVRQRVRQRLGPAEEPLGV